MTITKDMLEAELVELQKQYVAATATLRAIEGAVFQTKALITKLDEPEPQEPPK